LCHFPLAPPFALNFPEIRRFERRSNGSIRIEPGLTTNKRASRKFPRRHFKNPIAPPL
jgi:hypothetical protein